MSNSFQFKLEGGLQPDVFFCLRVDGPINGGLIIGSLRYSKITSMLKKSGLG